MNAVQLLRRLERRRDSYRRWQMRFAAWLQLWTGIVVLAFVLRPFVEPLSWQVVAWIALGETIITILVWITHGLLIRTEISRAELERTVTEAMAAS